MEAIWNTIKNLDYSGIPIGKIIAVLIILTLTQTLRQFVVAAIVKTIERFTSKTETNLDDELVEILKPSLSWLILIGGLWLVKQILAQELGSQLSETIGNLLNLVVVFIVAYAIYRASSK